MKRLTILALLSGSLFAATQDASLEPAAREPASFAAYYVVRTAEISLPPRAIIQNVTVSVSDCIGVYWSGVSKDWLVSCATKGESRILEFWPWPVPPGAEIKTLVKIGELDRVLLIDPKEDAKSMPIRPRVSIHVFYSDIGPQGSGPYMITKSLMINDAKIEVQMWK